MSNKPLAVKIQDGYVKFMDEEKNVEAVKNLDLEVYAGEFFTLVGNSGCGKTTALQMIGGIVDDVKKEISGEILVYGDPPAKAKAKKEMGVVFQKKINYPQRNVLGNITFYLDIMGFDKSKANQKAYELLEMVGMKDRAQAQISKLSGGETQRVALARTLTYDPKLLLLDEPFTGIDEFFQEELYMEILKIWRKTQKTIILVTHKMTEATFLSDRVAIMSPRPGRIVERFHVDLPRPRTLEMRGKENFYEYVERIRQLFRENNNS